DNGNTWTTLLDMSALPLFNGTISYNKWEQPYSVNLSPYYWERIDIAWQAYDGGGQGLWYNWAVDDCRVGSKKLTLTVQNDGPEGYYIYRKDPGSAVFKQLNSELVTDTSWVDTEVDQGMNSYFILTVFSACNAPSDTLMLNVITGVNPDPVKRKIKIYPNPAGDFFCLESSEPVEKVIISDQTGNNISVLFFNKEEKITLSSETLSPGVYFLRIITEKNQYISKIVILH
ncbi:MAG: T9SS type A sorting domain-containing protein, partial [Bacteroidota bacterium]|nr:T9SS type A sorting domain-containing protein [Bacteroidota bacterium]